MLIIDFFKTISKYLKYTIGKLTKGWRTPVFKDSSVGSRDGCRPLSTPIMKRFLSIVSGFAFTFREYISQHVPMTASET